MRTLEEIEKEIAETKAELENVHGTETEVYARIVGYYRAVRNWNKGKRDEFNSRKMFDIENTEKKNFEHSKTEARAEKTQFCPSSEETEKTLFDTGITASDSYYEIYTRKTCPNCPPVKEYMEHINLQGKNVDVDSEQGLSEAAEKGVFAAPTVIIYSKDGTETARAHNVQELKEIFEKVPVEV